MIAYFIHNLFVFDNITSYILFFAVLAFINIHERKSIPYPAFFRPIANENTITAGSIIAMIACGFSLYYFTIAPYLSGASLIKALTYENYALSQNNELEFKAALQSFQTSISYNTEGKDQAREQLLQSLPTILGSSASDATKLAITPMSKCSSR